jgi:hypothetical protein
MPLAGGTIQFQNLQQFGKHAGLEDGSEKGNAIRSLILRVSTIPYRKKV